MADRVSTAEVLNVLRDSYDIVPKAIEQLYGFLCLNFKVVMEKDKCVPDGNGNMIMKFTESGQVGDIGLQHRMQKKLKEDGIKASLPVAALNGETIIQYENDTGKIFDVQLLTFLEGIPMVEAELTRHEMEDIAFELGNFVGRMHKSLMVLEYEAIASNIINDYHAENAMNFRKKLFYIKDERIHKLMAKYLDSFQQHFLPRQHELRKVISHADISDGNIILRKDSANWRVFGVIDFEDSYLGYVVGDFGVCVAYTLLRAGGVPNCNILEVSKKVVQGYLCNQSLTATEKDVLFDVVTSRIVVSYTTACFKSHMEPKNREFLFRQSLNAPAVLQKIDDIGREIFERTWFN